MPYSASLEDFAEGIRTSDQSFTTAATLTYTATTDSGDITHSSGEWTVSNTGVLSVNVSLSVYRTSGTTTSDTRFWLEKYTGGAWGIVSGTLRFEQVSDVGGTLSLHRFLDWGTSGDKLKVVIERNYGTAAVAVNQASIDLSWRSLS